MTAHFLGTIKMSYKTLEKCFDKDFLPQFSHPKIFCQLVTVQAFSAQSFMPQKDLHITPKVSCFSFKYVIIAT